MRLSIIIVFALTLGGCNSIDYVDWHGVWFGCPAGQVEKPAVRGMFGIVKYPSFCEDAQSEAFRKAIASYDPVRRAKLVMDFAECAPPGTDITKEVDACMAKKGWLK